MFKVNKIDEILEITPMILEDNRGYFLKSYEKDIFCEYGIKEQISETFESLSTKGVLRGLHFQSKNPQIKMVRVITGEILDVIVDIRKSSTNFKKYYKFNISSLNKKIVVVPRGFAHGFLVLSDIALVSYSCIGKYLKEYDSGIIYNDKNININWSFNLVDKIIISDKDKRLLSLEELDKRGILL
ncbi:dTDP-4-dehydrorhamnose 3,5-epimerase [Candidatus Epulonipiscioides gigas]|nr:dTDP-4-dehydrorhamnose 3,5-epimerase [Epulopiscium sp. SCG-C07WGA-EpuloA2]